MLKMLTHFPSSSIAAVALLTLFTFATVSKSEEQTFSSALTGPRTNATGFAQLSLTPDTGDVSVAELPFQSLYLCSHPVQQ